MRRLTSRLWRYVLPALLAPTVVLACPAAAPAGSSADWISVELPAPYTRATSERAVVAVSQGSDGAVWAATNDGAVYVLRENASKWTRVTSGLPSGPGDEGIAGVEDILAAAGKVYLNSEEGVFVLPRGGDHWRRVSEFWEPQVFYLTAWGGSVWGAGAEGVQRLDPGTDRWAELSDGLPYFAGDLTHVGLSGWLAGTQDYLYVGVQESRTDNPRFDRAGVYRLRKGETQWQNAGLTVKLAPQEIQHLKEEKTAKGAGWGPDDLWTSGGFVLAEWGGLSYEGFARFYVLDETSRRWTQLQEPGSTPGGGGSGGVLEELADVYVLPGGDGRFAFVGSSDARAGTAEAMVYDAADDSWSSATLPVVGWPAGGWSDRDTSWGWVLAGDHIVVGDPEGEYAPIENGFVASVPLPTEVSREPGVIGTNLVLALIFAVGFGFTSTLFNSTLRENHETLRRWATPVLSPVATVMGKLTTRLSGSGERSRLRRLLEPVSIVVLAALIYSFLDPTFALSWEGLQLFLSLLVSVAVVTYLYEGLQCRLCVTHYHAPAALRLYPAALLVAIGCVVVSRIAGFSPGYLYGFVGAMAFLSSAQPSLACRGRMVLIASLGLLAVSVGTWFLAVPLSDAAAGGGWFVQLLQGTAVAVFVAGLESVFFGLVPLSFMDGETLLRWRKPAWLAVFAAVAFMFWHVLLNKDSQYAAAFSGQSTRVMVGLLGAFTALTFVSYFYFRSRRPRSAAVAGEAAAAGTPTAAALPEAGPASAAVVQSAAVVAAPAVATQATAAATHAPLAAPQAPAAVAAPAAAVAPRATAAAQPSAARRHPQRAAVAAGLLGILAGCSLLYAYEMPWYEQTARYVLYYRNPPGLIACGLFLLLVGIITAACRRRRKTVLILGVTSLVLGGLAVYVTAGGRSTLEDAGVAIGGMYGTALALSALALLPGVVAIVAAGRKGWRSKVPAAGSATGAAAAATGAAAAAAVWPQSASGATRTARYGHCPACRQSAWEGAAGHCATCGTALVSLQVIEVPAQEADPSPGASATATSATAVTGEPDGIEVLRKLAALRDEGIITADEFAAKRAEILRRL